MRLRPKRINRMGTDGKKRTVRNGFLLRPTQLAALRLFLAVAAAFTGVVKGLDAAAGIGFIPANFTGLDANEKFAYRMPG